MLERPHLKRALASAAFDGDGVATFDKAIVEDGVVASYLLGSYSARRMGLTTTANAGGTHNVLLEGDAVPRDALVARVGRGLFITEMMGQGVNLVTGDYSRGVAGFWIEGGVITHPVDETTIAGNLKDMLAGIVGLGDRRRSARRHPDRIGHGRCDDGRGRLIATLVSAIASRPGDRSDEFRGRRASRARGTRRNPPRR